MPAALTERKSAVLLKEIQRRFLAGLREGAERIDAPSEPLIAEPPEGTAQHRWHLYAEGYLIRLVEAIENDYPALARILGPSAFRSLCGRYLRTYPPSSYDIGRSGDRLPGFLASDRLLERLPFLADLARFELALARAIVAVDARPTTREQLAALGVEGILDLPLELSPGAVLISSEWPVDAIWALKDVPDEEVSLEIAGRPARLVLYREGLEVRWREASVDEARFLEAAAGGASLAGMLESGRFGRAEEAAPLLVSLFRSAIESSIVRIART